MLRRAPPSVARSPTPGPRIGTGAVAVRPEQLRLDLGVAVEW